MANIDLGNLTRYDGKIKQYAEDKYLSKNTANWQMTEKAETVTCYPVPDTELEPIVDFSFKEVLPISGDKSPTNPSIITGISSITVIQCETTSVDETQYTVNLNNTYYGGSVNLATGLMTVTHWGHVFDGTESASNFDTLTNNGRCIFFSNVLQAKNATNQTCTHLPLLTNFTSDTTHFYVNYAGTNTGLAMFTPYLTLSDFKSWLAEQYASGTPVTVACELKTPYTVQLTPMQIKSLFALDKNTPRLNTLYTDADSIQVGYQKHPARTAYELENAILALGGNE